MMYTKYIITRHRRLSILDLLAVSLKARLLDHRIVEFAWRLPMSLRVGKGQGKWLLRQVFEAHLRPVHQRWGERTCISFGMS